MAKSNITKDAMIEWLQDLKPGMYKDDDGTEWGVIEDKCDRSDINMIDAIIQALR
jgi:hypothetical protein